MGRKSESYWPFFKLFKKRVVRISTNRWQQLPLKRSKGSPWKEGNLMQRYDCWRWFPRSGRKVSAASRWMRRRPNRPLESDTVAAAANTTSAAGGRSACRPHRPPAGWPCHQSTAVTHRLHPSPFSANRSTRSARWCPGRRIRPSGWHLAVDPRASCHLARICCPTRSKPFWIFRRENQLIHFHEFHEFRHN